MQMLIKRLEIVRAAMSLADEALIAQQLPALRAALADLPANSTPQAVLALIIEALESGHYPRAMQRINAFLAAQAALVVHLDEELAVLRLERLVSAQTLERDEMQERLERFSRDFLACCGAPLQEIFALREAIARLEWQQLRRARAMPRRRRVISARRMRIIWMPRRRTRIARRRSKIGRMRQTRGRSCSTFMTSIATGWTASTLRRWTGRMTRKRWRMRILSRRSVSARNLRATRRNPRKRKPPSLPLLKSLPTRRRA